MMVVALTLALMAALASTALAAPAWNLDVNTNSTAAAGGTIDYHLQFTDITADPADGTGGDPIVFTASLPADVTVDSMGVLIPGLGTFDWTMLGWNCTGDGPGAAPNVVGAHNLTCSIADTIAPHSFMLGIGAPARPVLTADVSGAAAGTQESTFGLSGGGATAVGTAEVTRIDPDPPAFGVDSFDGAVTADAAGTPYTQAGGHPYGVVSMIDFNTDTNPNPLIGPLWPIAAPKQLKVDLPPGFVGYATAAATCTTGELAAGPSTCPAASQVGTTIVRLGFGEGNFLGPLPVYNVEPPPDAPARLGFNAYGSVVTLNAELRSDTDYGLTLKTSALPEALAFTGTTFAIWGFPADDGHTPERACPGQLPPEYAPTAPTVSCANGGRLRAFLRNPTLCTAPGSGLTTTMRADSWKDPGSFVEASFVSHESPGYPYDKSNWGPEVGITGCDRVPFDPTFRAAPAAPARAGAPTGFTFDLDVPQSDDPGTVGESDLRKAVVTLPEGVRLSPASSQGLGACTPAQIGLHTTDEPTCPGASKIGDVTVTTPLLNDALTGAIYLGAPHDNPFDTLLSLYLVVKGHGVIIKLPGKVEADPLTGQLTTTFDDNPQLPFSNLHLSFNDGPRAPLVTPSQCGTYTTHAVMTGWNGRTVTSDSTFSISGDGAGGPCPAPQFKPTLSAGVTNPIAGSSSSFTLRLQRDDIDNEFKTISTTMPPGLLAKVAGVPLCSDASATAGNCPADSQIGRVEVGAGTGPNPFYITNGKVYVTEGYKGGPYGLAISVPAVAGPFDLGTVNVRAALQIDPLTAQVTVVSDPMPRILEGIPLQVRDVRVIVDRDGFMQSPTNCSEMTVGATIGSYSDDSATVLNRFQVGECGGLAFAPKISMGFTNRSQVHKRKKPGLDFRLSQKPGEANIKSVTVKLPRSVVLDVNGASGALCEVAQAENGSCPASSIVGHATAVTPLLDQPLSGAVYFVRGDNALPNIMVALRGAININLRSKSKVDKMGRLISTFGTVPDAPISQFHLTLGSAGRGVLSVAPDSDLCKGHNSKGKVSIAIVGQNGKREAMALKIKTPCKKARRHKR